MVSPPSIEEIRRRMALHPPDPPAAPTGVEAAVLLLLTGARSEPNVLFTKRSQEVEHHKGEISFPGGMVESKDSGALAAALRETHEEMGIPPDAVEVLGALHETGTLASGFRIVPFAGALHRPVPFRPSPIEIERVFEVPLTWFLDLANEQKVQVSFDGRERPMYIYTWEGESIWGATARILHDFLSLLR